MDKEESFIKKMEKEYVVYISQISNDTTFLLHGKVYKFCNLSLGFLDNKNKFRIFCTWVITSRWFENLIIFFILLNSVLLGIKDYKDFDNETQINQYIEMSEPFFTYMFLMECLFKCIAMGFICDSRSYLSDSWNILDFSVVVASMLN